MPPSRKTETSTAAAARPAARAMPSVERARPQQARAVDAQRQAAAAQQERAPVEAGAGRRGHAGLDRGQALARPRRRRGAAARRGSTRRSSGGASVDQLAVWMVGARGDQHPQRVLAERPVAAPAASRRRSAPRPGSANRSSSVASSPTSVGLPQKRAPCRPPRRAVSFSGSRPRLDLVGAGDLGRGDPAAATASPCRASAARPSRRRSADRRGAGRHRRRSRSRRRCRSRACARAASRRSGRSAA